MITVREASEILDVTITATHGAIRRGRIKAKKFGVQYMVSKESVLEYQKTRGPGPGHPKPESGGDSPTR